MIEKFSKMAPIIIIYSVLMKLDKRVPSGRKIKNDRFLKDAIK